MLQGHRIHQNDFEADRDNDRQGYDRQGYDRQGCDRQGCDRQGCDRQGCDRQGWGLDVKRFAFLATFAVGCMALASNVDNTTRYFKGGIDIVGGDIKQSKTDATFAIKSDTADGTTSTTVAAVTLSSTVNVTNGDLVLNV